MYNYEVVSSAGGASVGSFVIIYLLLMALMTILPMVIAGVVAKKKGKSVALWVFLAMFLGWVAVIIVALSEQEYNTDRNGRDKYGAPNNQSYGGYEPSDPYGNFRYDENAKSANFTDDVNDACGEFVKDKDGCNVADDVNDACDLYRVKCGNADLNEVNDRTYKIEKRSGFGWTCKSCGAFNNSNGEFCSYCGTSRADKERG